MSLDPKAFTEHQVLAIEGEVRAAMEMARKNALKEAIAWLEQVAKECSAYPPRPRQGAAQALTALEVHLRAQLERGMPYQPFAHRPTVEELPEAAGRKQRTLVRAAGRHEPSESEPAHGSGEN